MNHLIIWKKSHDLHICKFTLTILVLIKSDHFDTSDRTWFCLFTSHNKEQHILQITPVLFLLTSPAWRHFKTVWGQTHLTCWQTITPKTLKHTGMMWAFRSGSFCCMEWRWTCSWDLQQQEHTSKTHDNRNTRTYSTHHVWHPEIKHKITHHVTLKGIEPVRAFVVAGRADIFSLSLSLPLSHTHTHTLTGLSDTTPLEWASTPARLDPTDPIPDAEERERGERGADERYSPSSNLEIRESTSSSSAITDWLTPAARSNTARARGARTSLLTFTEAVTRWTETPSHSYTAPAVLRALFIYSFKVNES